MTKLIHFAPLSDGSGDQSGDALLFEQGPHPLDVFFHPKTVAVIGASDRTGTPGNTIFDNLLKESFGGSAYAVNPTRKTVLGQQAYPTINDVPAHVELAVIVTPAKTVPGIVSECIRAGVRGAIVISSGFREHGPEGKALEEDIQNRIRGTQLRVIGPNCLGVMNPITGMNASFARKLALPGSVAFISQSGAMCTAILDWSLTEVLGFSAFVSVGSMLDIGWGDMIDYLGSDPHTESIVIYMESIGDAKSFLSAAREVALRKPIIVIKAGRTEAAAKAAASHTGALAGSDAVLDAAFRRAGVLRVDNIEDLFHMAEVLAKQPRPKGRRLAIVTNAGGPGVLAADALMAGGGELAPLAQETMQELNKILPANWSHGNPIDTLADASEDAFDKALELAVKDPTADGVIAMTAPLVSEDPMIKARNIAKYAKHGKPIIASFMGAEESVAATALLSAAGVPTFQFPDTAVRIFNHMWRSSENLKLLYETPTTVTEVQPDIDVASALIETARKERRTILTEAESKHLLAAYGIPVVQTIACRTIEEAEQAALRIKFPVVVKLLSKTITHKTDVGGVRLDLRTTKDVREAFSSIQQSVNEQFSASDFDGVTVQPMIQRRGFELLLGSSIDSQFGPVLAFGLGGVFVELFKDTALGLPPLTTTLARRMMEQTRVWQAMNSKNARGITVDQDQLERILVAFSQLVSQQPWIKEIDINPLLASSEGILALDARIVLHDPSTAVQDLPKPSIRPYPVHYAGNWLLPNGDNVLIRPIRPEDEPAMVRFHSTLSERSVYYRYHRPIDLSVRTTHERLTRICFIDYDRELALVACRNLPGKNCREIIGVARLRKVRSNSTEAACAIVVSDAYQHMGLGTELMTRLIEIAKQEGLSIVRMQMLAENKDVISIAQKQGLDILPDGEFVTAEMEL